MRETGQRERIMEAAKRRFAHFGIAKTTLTEIADDLSLTKQALGHYFPDKQGLIRAVTADLLEQYMTALGEAFEAAPTVYEGLQELVALRSRFSRPYFLFFGQLENEGQWFNRAAKAMLLRMARREQLLLEALFRRGMASGELHFLEPRPAARVLLDTLLSLGRVGRNCLPDAQLFDTVERQQRALLTLIYNGLGQQPWKQ